MSDPKDATGGVPPTEGGESKPTEITNLKAEFNRKLSNLEEQNARLEQLIKMSLSSGSSPKTVHTPNVEPDAKLSDLIYTDPEKAAAIIQNKALESANNMVNQRMADKTAREQVAFQLVQEYPELNDQSSELYQETVKAYNKLSDTERLSPNSYKLAAREAAAVLGVLPNSKRQTSDNDNYSMKGSGSAGAGGRQPRGSRKSDIDPMTLEFSRLLGRDTSDPKVIDGLKKATERNAWNKYK